MIYRMHTFFGYTPADLGDDVEDSAELLLSHTALSKNCRLRLIMRWDFSRRRTVLVLVGSNSAIFVFSY